MHIGYTLVAPEWDAQAFKGWLAKQNVQVRQLEHIELIIDRSEEANLRTLLAPYQRPDLEGSIYARLQRHLLGFDYSPGTTDAKDVVVNDRKFPSVTLTYLGTRADFRGRFHTNAGCYEVDLL